MSDAPLARWTAAAWTLLIASSALYFLADNEADNDLWMHLFTGRLIWSSGAVPYVDTFSYTAAGSPWIDHEWLTQVGFAGIFAALGATGLWLAKLGIGLGTAWVVWRLVERHSTSIWARGTAMLIAIAAMARGYAVRPQIVTYLAVAALLALLDRAGDSPPRSISKTAAITLFGFAIWANAHGGFVVGLGVLLLFVVTPTAFGGPQLSGSARLVLILAGLIGACLTPYGPKLFSYIADELQAPHPLSEWQRLQLAGHVPAVALMLALVATLKYGRLLRRRLWWGAALALLAVMALRHQRHAPLFAIVAAAPLADQLNGVLDRLGQQDRVRLSVVSLAALTLALVAVAAFQLRTLVLRVIDARGGIVYAAEEYPVGALRFVRERGLRGNLAVPLDWGGYALWYVAPEVKISLDGRFATVYPPQVVADNFAFYSGTGSGETTALLDSYDTNLAVVPTGLTTALPYHVGWHLLYRDDVAELYGRQPLRDSTTAEAPHGWQQFP